MMAILSSYRIQTVKRQNKTIVFRSSYLKFGFFATAEAHNGDEETFPIAQEISLRKKPDERINNIFKFSSVLLRRDWIVLSWWQENGTDHIFQLLQFALRQSVRLSLPLSFSPSFSFSLPPSLSFADIVCASLSSSLDLVGGFFWDPSSAPQWMREPWEFSQTWRGKKNNLFAAVGANQAWRAAEPFHSGRETKRCYYKNVMNVFIFQQKGVNMLWGVSDALGGFVRKMPAVAHFFWVRMTVYGAVWTHDKPFY